MAEIRKENQTNEIYFSSYFNSHTPQTEREYHDSGAVGVGGCLRFRVDEFFSLDSFIDFHACLLLQKPTKKTNAKKESVSMYTVSQTHTHTLSKCDVNNPTYLLNLCTFVTG